MRAKELMIGDWVDFYHPHEPEKKIVTRHRITETFECGLVGISDHNNPVHADHIEPIPLTTEVLENNGFTLQDIVNMAYRREFAEGIYINIDFKSKEPFVAIHNRCYYAVPYCIYVHHLQHALRLCGIDLEIVI